jgi:glycosyltransferase involved in cell wall biosynthesis
MKNSTVSVIIPCYNSISTIDRAINSVINQTFKCTDIIIIDDCSSDETYAHLLNLKEEIKPRIHIILERNEENMGPSFSRNRGLKLATGTWIAFLDSDDSWHPQKLQIQLDVAKKYQCSFVGTQFGIHTKFTQIPKGKNIEIKPLTKFNFLWKNHFSTPTVLIKKNPLLQFDSSMRYAEDFDLWTRMINHFGLAILIQEKLVSLGSSPFLGNGLSSKLLDMEKGELNVLKREDNFVFRLLAITYSLFKFSRRLFIKLIST